MQLLTTPRKGMDKTQARPQMIREMQTKQNRRIYKHRSTTVEPMQDLPTKEFPNQRKNLSVSLQGFDLRVSSLKSCA